MVSLADAPVNLFEKELPSFDEIKTLWQYVNSSEINRIEFRETTAEQKDALTKGIALLLCGEPADAVELLEKVRHVPKDTWRWDTHTANSAKRKRP